MILNQSSGQSSVLQVLISLAVGVIVITAAAGLTTYIRRIQETTSARKEANSSVLVLEKRLAKRTECERVFRGMKDFFPENIQESNEDTHYVFSELLLQDEAAPETGATGAATGGFGIGTLKPDPPPVLFKTGEYVEGTKIMVKKISIPKVTNIRTIELNNLSSATLRLTMAQVFAGKELAEFSQDLTFDIVTNRVNGLFVECQGNVASDLGIKTNCPFENSEFVKIAPSAPAHAVGCIQANFGIAQNHDVRDQLKSDYEARAPWDQHFFVSEGGGKVEGTVMTGVGQLVSEMGEGIHSRACLDDGVTNCQPPSAVGESIQLFKSPCDQITADLNYDATEPVPEASQCVQVSCPNEKKMLAGWGYRHIFIEDPVSPPPGTDPAFDYRYKRNEITQNGATGQIKFCLRTRNGVTYTPSSVSPDVGNAAAPVMYRPGVAKGWRLNLWGYCCEKN